MMATLPHYAVIGNAEATHTVGILHGILGSNRNWRSFARRLVAELPDWRAVLVDLRCHGASTHLPAPHTLDACASDLMTLESDLGRPFDAVMGHSFGGKVALAWAQQVEGRQARVLVLDSPPGATHRRVADALSAEPGQRLDTDTSAVERVLHAIRDAPMPVSDRRDVSRFLVARGFSEGLAAWMTTNLRRDEDGLHWAFDLQGVDELLADYRRTDFWPLVERPNPGLELTQVWARQSDRWLSHDLDRLAKIRHPRSHVVALKDAGHWLHVDNAAGLLAIVAERLRTASVL